jgi:endonuclease/exonuclease/phosphatase family metal-dependent hydrolase
MTQVLKNGLIIPSNETRNLEVGTFRSTEDIHEPDTIVVGSFNIRYAVGPYLITGGFLRKTGIHSPSRRPGLIRKNLARAAHALSSGRAMPAIDILGLQEADVRTRRAGGIHIARELASALGYDFAHAPNLVPAGVIPEKKQWYLDFEEPIDTFDDGDTGVALLSRLAFENVRRIELPSFGCDWRPRVAVASEFVAWQRRITVVNVHIDPHASTDEQLEQHQAVIDVIDDANNPAVILGDFNTLSVAAAQKVRAFLEARGFTTPFANSLPTWRAGLIKLHPDWIFGRDVKFDRWGVCRPLRVSDHWPVWAALSLG